jgi:diketogulonate reductase-like aldo/keto reductase
MSFMTTNRRDFLTHSAALAATASLPVNAFGAAPLTMNKRLIPGNHEAIPVVGSGSPDMFYVMPPEGEALPKSLIQTFADNGGTLIDTPAFFRPDVPVLGKFLQEMQLEQKMFLIGKITVQGKQAGIDHLDKTIAALGKRPMDAMLVHNMLQMENHWPTLKQAKEEGKVRHIGVSRTRVTDFAPLEKFMKEEKPDFLLIGYSAFQEGPAERILPLARDLGTAVICAEVFKTEDDGMFFKKVAGKKLPEWAADFDCTSWAQFAIKYVLGNPAITSVVVETSKVTNAIDNLHGGFGRFPDQATRKKMSEVLLTMS